MTRANRLGVEGGIFHLTHRCHDRSFLLKFAKDRNAYRERMREKLMVFDLSLLDYCLTCNHVHLIVDSEDRGQVSGFMRELAGEHAKAYNWRKGRQNAYWGDNYHATSIDSGRYLWRCLVYVELNMIRCGVVGHPRQWEWVGYHEIMGHRRRYRLLDLDRLLWRLDGLSMEELRSSLDAALLEAMAREDLKRQAAWTESLAVGSRAFVQEAQGWMHTRRETEMISHPQDTWILRELPIPYIAKLGPK